MPSNSHIHYNFLISYASLPQYMQEYWYKHEAYTYVLLDSPERKAEIEKRISCDGGEIQDRGSTEK